jgi:hypothetical protein
MKGGQALAALALVLAAADVRAADEKAVPRGGGSGSSSAGERHHSGASASRAESGSGSSSSSSSSHVSAPLTDAQRRHPRAGTGTGWRRGGRGGVSYYGSPYWGDPYRYSWYGPRYYGWNFGYSGYSPYYYSGYYGYSPYYHRYRADRAGALRILVEPNKTRVYVDGYYAGIADDFDGIFQRLHLSPGRHDISLRLEGYRTHNLKIYVPYDHTIKVHHDMMQGASGESTSDVIGDPADERYARRERERDLYDEEADSDDEEDLGPGNMRGEHGSLRLSVTPGDASVYVDGAFRGTGRLRTLRLPAGTHRVEVVRPGYRTVEREVEVRPGRTAELSIDLDRS